MAQRRSLFAGDSAGGPQGAAAVLGAGRRPGRRAVLRRDPGVVPPHQVASSGHSLWEEELMHHVPLEGNGLKVLGRMDIPGLDMLTSDPEAVIHSGWMTAGAAHLGRRAAPAAAA